MRKNLCILLAVLCLLTAHALWANTALEVTTLALEQEQLPAAFDGFRMAQVSDLHNAAFWEDVVQELESAQPDIILLTGDLVDSGKTDIAQAMAFVREAVKIAPCFHVTGNHEAWIPEWPDLRQELLDSGVRVLENESVSLERDGTTVTLLGLTDPAFGGNPARALEELTAGEGYTILLSHRPELFDLYRAFGVDLVFTGHAHGGQFRLPFLGGLVAPDQGLFPEYDSGLHESGKTAMVVSRGIGNSIIPLRINNRPELVVMELMVSVGISR